VRDLIEGNQLEGASGVGAGVSEQLKAKLLELRDKA